MACKMVVIISLAGAMSSAFAFSPPLALPQRILCTHAGAQLGAYVRSLGRSSRVGPERSSPAGCWVMRGQDFQEKLGGLADFIDNSFSSQEKRFLSQLTVEQVMELKDLLDPGSVHQDTSMLPESRAHAPSRGAEITISDEEYDRLRLALLEAADLGDIAVVKTLLATETGQQVVLATDRNQHSALHIACIEGHLNVVKELVEAGGRVLLLHQDNYGSTALHFASQRGRFDVVAFLAEKGGQELLRAQDRNGRTAAQLASYYGQPKVCEYLSKVKLEHDFGV